MDGGTGNTTRGCAGCEQYHDDCHQGKAQRVWYTQIFGCYAASRFEYDTRRDLALVGVSGLLGLFAGLLALFIADLLTRPITRSVDADVLFDTPTIDLKIALAAIVALGIASLLAALIPARHAMKIDPVEALRAE